MPLAEVRAAFSDLPPLELRFTTPEGVEVYGFDAASFDDARAWWERLRDAHPSTGLWPVVVRRPVEEIHDGQKPWDPAEWEGFEPPRGEPWTAADLGLEEEEFDDEEEEEDTYHRPERHSLSYDIMGGEPPPVAVQLVPAEAGWFVPVVLHFGWFNDCPEAPYHAAVIRSWQRRYGAEVFSMGHDFIEMVVARPPTTQEEAELVAAELAAYAWDNFNDSSLSKLAARLVGERIWMAWWD